MVIYGLVSTVNVTARDSARVENQWYGFVPKQSSYYWEIASSVYEYALVFEILLPPRNDARLPSLRGTPRGLKAHGTAMSRSSLHNNRRLFPW